MIFFLILEGFTYPVLSGLIPFSVGVSLLIFYIIRATRSKARNGQ